MAVIPQAGARTIVVGVDGSADSEAALQWAVTEAGQTHRRLLLIHTITIHESLSLAPFSLVGFPDAASFGADVLRRAAQRCRDSGVGVSCSLVEGSPADSLVEATDGAAMLVVGARGHGRGASLVLGSVSQECARRAKCPVVVVKPNGDTDSSTPGTPRAVPG